MNYPPIWLRTEGDSKVVLIQVEGRWVEVIRDNGTNISHIAEPSGIASAIDLSRRYGDSR